MIGSWSNSCRPRQSRQTAFKGLVSEEVSKISSEVHEASTNLLKLVLIEATEELDKSFSKTQELKDTVL